MGAAFFRNAQWLGRERAGGYLWLFAALNLATLLYIVATSRDGVDRNGFLLGTDFLSFWTAGRMLQAQSNVYDVAAHTFAQRAYFDDGDAYTAFFYPPTFLPFCYPLGFLPYFPALLTWLSATAAVYLATARLWLREAGVSRPLLLLAAAFPPVLIAMTHGQTSFLVAALLGLGAYGVRRWPVMAGACFGLATIKPQFGLLVPLVLLLTAEWRVIISAGATAVLLALAATIAFGPEIWPQWLAVSGAAEAAMNDGAMGFAKMQSVFAASRLLGAPLGVAYTLQIAAALAVVGSIGWAAWRRRFTPALASAMLAGALLVTPFVLDYDLVLLAFPLIWLVSGGFRPWEKLIAALTFAAAAVARSLALYAGAPIMPIVLAAFFVVLVRRAAEVPRE